MKMEVLSREIQEQNFTWIINNLVFYEELNMIIVKSKNISFYSQSTYIDDIKTTELYRINSNKSSQKVILKEFDFYAEEQERDS